VLLAECCEFVILEIGAIAPRVNINRETGRTKKQRVYCREKVSPCNRPYAEAGGVSLYERYLYASAFPGHLQGTGDGPLRERSVCGSRSNAPGGGPKTSPRPTSQHAGKRKTNKLASLDDSIEPANTCPTPGAGSAPLPANSSLTSEIVVAGSRQLKTSEGGVTYAAVLAGTVALFQSSGPLNLTAMGSEMSEHSVSSETANRRMSENQDGTTAHVRMTNNCLQAGKLLNKRPVFIRGDSDVRNFLACLRASSPRRYINCRRVQSRGQRTAVPPWGV